MTANMHHIATILGSTKYATCETPLLPAVGGSTSKQQTQVSDRVLEGHGHKPNSLSQAMHRPVAHMAQADQGLSPAVLPGSAEVLLRPMLPPHKHKSLSDRHRQSGLQYVASSGPRVTDTTGKLCRSISKPPCAVDVSRFVCAYSMSSANQTALAWGTKQPLWLSKISNSRCSRHSLVQHCLAHTAKLSGMPPMVYVHKQCLQCESSSRLSDNFLS